MFARLLSYFAERARIRAANERAIVLIAWHDALDRRDSRAQHQLKPGVVHATCATLAAEMGRSPSAWRGNR